MLLHCVSNVRSSIRRLSAVVFGLCRFFVNQLGLLQWNKRPHFDLLKKSDALLRELKHLDNQRKYETSAADDQDEE